MPFVAAKCTQCGANLEIDSTKNTAVCPNCNTTFVVEKAVNYHNTYHQNQYTIEHSEVHFFDEQSKEMRLKNARTFWVKHNDRERAILIYEEVASHAPDDYRGWWGLAQITSKDFTDIECGESLFAEIKEYVQRAFNVAPPDIQENLMPVWNQYAETVKKEQRVRKNQRASLAARQKSMEEKRQNIERQLQEKWKQVEQMTMQQEIDFERLQAPSGWWYILGGILLLAYGIGLILLFLLFGRLAFLKKKIHTREKELAEYHNDIESMEKQINQVNESIDQIDNQLQVMDRITM